MEPMTCNINAYATLETSEQLQEGDRKWRRGSRGLYISLDFRWKGYEVAREEYKCNEFEGSFGDAHEKGMSILLCIEDYNQYMWGVDIPDQLPSWDYHTPYLAPDGLCFSGHVTL